MMHWVELGIAGVVGFCLGAVFIGALLKSAQQVAFEDRLIRTLQEQQRRDRDEDNGKP
jgi:hypothetical protein